MFSIQTCQRFPSILGPVDNTQEKLYTGWMPKRSARRSKQPRSRSNNRLEVLLDASAQCFAEKGYRETTIRDISESIDMLPGSVYYHFSSKHALLLAVYKVGVERIEERIEAALESSTDPWQRLEAVAVAHLEAVLDQSDYARVIIRVLPDHVPEVRKELTRLRDRYEKHFRNAIDDLKLRKSVDRRILRLFLLGALNWTQSWYRTGPSDPRDVARTFMRLLKEPLDYSTYRKK